MTTLFERITNPPLDNGNPADSKIAIHAVRPLFRELELGNVTINDITSELSLTVSQKDDAILLAGYIAASVDKSEFLEFLFSFWLLAEVNIIPSVYRDEVEFWNRASTHG